ncbi:MAG: DNA-packaging protein, partial [Vitreimonas sp.]
GTRLEAQELEGLIVDDGAALFTAEQFARLRAPAPRHFERIVVGVDPPAGRFGSACGIVVAARSGDSGYVLEDCTAAGLSPLGWASRAVEAARRHGAACIVAEANQGGDMVRAVLAQAAPPCPVKLVHASEGKRARAEPIALLYEQGRILHCGALAALEEEMMALGGEASAEASAQASDRADALVWALSDLMLTARLEPRIRQL